MNDSKYKARLTLELKRIEVLSTYFDNSLVVERGQYLEQIKKAGEHTNFITLKNVHNVFEMKRSDYKSEHVYGRRMFRFMYDDDAISVKPNRNYDFVFGAGWPSDNKQFIERLRLYGLNRVPTEFNYNDQY